MHIQVIFSRVMANQSLRYVHSCLDLAIRNEMTIHIHSQTSVAFEASAKSSLLVLAASSGVLSMKTSPPEAECPSITPSNI